LIISNEIKALKRNPKIQKKVQWQSEFGKK